MHVRIMAMGKVGYAGQQGAESFSETLASRGQGLRTGKSKVMRLMLVRIWWQLQ